MMGSKLAEPINNEIFIVDSCLKMSALCLLGIKKTNRLLELFGKGTVNKAEKIILPLYKCIVHPHTEDCVQIWSPHFKKIYLICKRYRKWQQKLVGIPNTFHMRRG